MPVNVLCAVRDVRAVMPLMRALEDGERCAFQIVTSGRQAVACALRSLPDILVIDALLPDLDGLGVMDRLRAQLGSRMPRVIGGSPMPFCSAAFIRRGAKAVVHVPWRRDELKRELVAQVRAAEESVDWDVMTEDCTRASQLLARMGMQAHLKGYAYLSMAAALASRCESRLFAVQKKIYRPIAQRCHTSAQNVERLIRHAVESTMDSTQARGVYGFFGNTIDAARGKPTNAQIIAMLAQKLRT